MAAAPPGWLLDESFHTAEDRNGVRVISLRPKRGDLINYPPRRFGDYVVPMTELPVRRAIVGDVPALVELRALMFGAMNVSGVESQLWRIQAADWFTEAMAREDICIMVIEGAKSQVSACAMGQVREAAPSPGNLSGLSGLVSNVVSAPSVRGRGYASRCLAGLMSWFKDETSVETVELFATDHGRHIYERAGFAEHHFPAMRIRLAR